jgi:hypothetical protein
VHGGQPRALSTFTIRAASPVALLLACTLIPVGLLAQSADVDWNFFGAAVINDRHAV